MYARPKRLRITLDGTIKFVFDEIFVLKMKFAEQIYKYKKEKKLRISEVKTIFPVEPIKM